ncbi:MAG: flavodoxin-dependent (E)-4-hydroxy-3-methylbut-2-enyl-diphosphate synthase, partial [Nitrospirota bacterium]
MHIARRKTRQISVGTVKVGGDAPVSVQSMCSTDTRDVTATVAEIHRLEAAGCEIIRVAVPDEEAAAVLPQIKAAMTVPLIADIHFDHRLALKAAAVVDCVRINPGNIGAWWKVEEVIKAVNDHGIPIRVGVNGGSLERPLLEKYGWPSPEALSESALNAVHALEDVGAARGGDEAEDLRSRVRGAPPERGGQGRGDCDWARNFGQIIAVCDVDEKHVAEAAKQFNAPHKYKDFRKVMERDDVHVVINGTPDHWHTLVNLAAIKAGKDIYSEKPLTLTIDEGKRLVKAVKEQKTVFQTGSQQRSDRNFRLACELVRNGRL